MKVLVLAAGYGTRLKELGEGTAKGLLPINGKPILNYIVDRVIDLKDLTEIIIVTNDKFYQDFVDWKNNNALSVPVDVVNDGTLTPEDRLGSIGDIDFVLKQKNITEDVIVVGGDNLFDFNLSVYLDFAEMHPESVTIGIYDIHDIEDAKLFGVVKADEESKIVSFQEKPENPASSMIAMCFYYLPKARLASIGQYLSEVEKSDTAGDFIRWLTEGQDVYAYEFKGEWLDIGSIESYNEAQEKFKA